MRFDLDTLRERAERLIAESEETGLLDTGEALEILAKLAGATRVRPVYPRVETVKVGDLVYQPDRTSPVNWVPLTQVALLPQTRRVLIEWRGHFVTPGHGSCIEVARQ